MDRRDSIGAEKKDIFFLGGVLLLVSLKSGTAPVSAVCACTMSSPSST